MTIQKRMAQKRASQASATLQAYRRIFASEDGQTVLKDLMKSCFCMTPSIGADPYQTYYNEGMRAVVLRMQNTSKMDESKIAALVKQIEVENDDMFS